ncbi:MAG: alpha-amylase family glycosyl hydrolase [Bacteroidota bacterium]
MLSRLLLLLLASIACLPSANAQEISVRRQGYLHQNDTSYFLFDGEIYNQKTPSRVVVTGSFRDWSQDMDDPKWQLTSNANSLWTLAVFNPNFELIPIHAEFKFRVDEGNWLSPPAEAPNAAGGNLQFMHTIKVPTFQAELRSGGRIWNRVEGTNRPLNPNAYRLTDGQGKEIPIAAVLPNTATEALIITTPPLDMRRVYFLELREAGLKTHCSFDSWFKELYSAKELGANVQDGKTDFRIFSPRAERVVLYLYEERLSPEAKETVEMRRDADGVWEASFDADLKGTFYDFTIHGPVEEGSHFYEALPKHISDPYARVNDDAWGRSRVWYKTTPATPLKSGIPKLEDVISYEVHVQDFTDLLPVADELKGTISGMVVPGLKNKKRQPIGFDYLVNLGINTVHLMPVQEYMHYPDELWRKSFADDPFFKEMEIAEENYQWGYRTSHCFAVENRYRTKGSELGSEREQFRDLVQAFHDKDIAVIIDIVPNHTAEDMDSEPHNFHFNVLDKLYYYRTRDLDHIGEYGNEVKTENRPMVQRWLIDQCKHFIEEFGIDGFRIDLAGQIDKQTLIKLRTELGDDIIIYGEPWIGSNDPNFESNPSWDWYKHDSPITFFQDETRDALIGNPFELSDPHAHRGYAGGYFHAKGKVKQALSAGFHDDKTPLSGINYLDIHDNWALADRFAKQDWNGLKGVDEERYKIAGLLLYTSVGPIVTHGGVEIMRSKGLAPLEEFVKPGEEWLEAHFKGRDDTYNMRRANTFLWETVGQTEKSRGSNCDYKGMLAFWQGLNQFRMSEHGKVFRRGEALSDYYYQWIETVNPYQLGYIVDNQVFVLINTGSDEHDWDNVILPEGNWKLIGNHSGINLQGVKDRKERMNIKGGENHYFRLDGTSFLLYVRE